MGTFTFRFRSGVIEMRAVRDRSKRKWIEFESHYEQFIVFLF